MIDKMLIDASKEGYNPKDIKDTVINVLEPYFDHREALNKFACESELLSVFEFFIRYHYDTSFADGVREVLRCYKDAYNKDNNQFWSIVLCTFKQMVNNENKMWTVRSNVPSKDYNDLYEKVINYMRHIGDNLEISAKHIIQEVYALIRLADNKVLDYQTIRKMDFGVVNQNILDLNLLQNVLTTLPSQMKLSDWRNIAYHHSYSIDGDIVICSYGKRNIKNISVDIKEFENYVHQIIRSCNILTIARCIFIFDYSSEISKSFITDKANFRQPMLVNQLVISLLSQGFNLCNIQDRKEKIEVDFVDLYVNGDVKERIIHCSQLLYRVWIIWNRKVVTINYIDNEDKKKCQLSVDGSVCKAIYKGEKDITSLAENFEIILL